MLRAYKVFDPNWECRDFQYELGKTYECNEAIPCKTGFHACLKLIDCFQYYDFNPANKVAIVEMGGTVAHHDWDSKVAATKITILEELSWHQVLELVNTGKDNTGHSNSGNSNSGHYNSGSYNSGSRNSGNSNSGHYNSGNYNSGSCNSGSRNSGSCNSGNYNSGDSNSGDSNSGHYNSGDSNSGSHNSGHSNSGSHNSGHYNSGNHNNGLFNVDEPTVKCFGKETNLKLSEIDVPYANLKYFETKDGKTIKYSYKEAWVNYWASIGENEKNRWKALPNFDAKIFEEITSIKV